MVGGIAFMVGGHMAGGVIGQDLRLRLGPEATQRALGEPLVRPMDFTGRPSGGMVYIGAAGVRDPSDLKRWIGAAAAFVATLPPRPSRVNRRPVANGQVARPLGRLLPAILSRLLSRPSPRRTCR